MMKKVSVDNFRCDPMFPRMERVVAEQLAKGNVVAPVGVLVGMGLLRPEHLADWRRGRVAYLEHVINCNLSRLSRLLRILRYGRLFARVGAAACLTVAGYAWILTQVGRGRPAGGSIESELQHFARVARSAACQARPARGGKSCGQAIVGMRSRLYHQPMVGRSWHCANYI